MRTIANFATRFRSGDFIIGTFVKTPDPAIVEVLARSAIDFVVLDAEHAPFSRRDLDLCLLAAREGNLPALVRVTHSDPVSIQQALDQGAAGVVVPHVRTPQEAQHVARISHFGSGGRGFAGSTRAADYTRRDIRAHLDATASSVVVVAQIEDAEAVEHSESIAGTAGIDGVFIGPVDLCISLGKTDVSDVTVQAAISAVARGVKIARKSVGIFVGKSSDVESYRNFELNFVLVRSDQSFVLNGADAACIEIRKTVSAT
ncbi:MAG: aldolase [Actinobacteria bacterium]|nr:aldolase [Actinomycetota bacterium]